MAAAAKQVLSVVRVDDGGITAEIVVISTGPPDPSLRYYWRLPQRSRFCSPCAQCHRLIYELSRHETYRIPRRRIV